MKFSTKPEEQWHGARMDFSKSMSYSDYLTLDQILSAQNPLSPSHDEMLFIIQHQSSELWMKLMLHELHALHAQVHSNDLPLAFKIMARVTRIMDQLVHSWGILATMTPPEYIAIRSYLGQSSGFQSCQYREIEFLLGNKNIKLLEPHQHLPGSHERLKNVLHQPSIYDEVVIILENVGLPIESERLNRDWSQPTTSNHSVEAAWLKIYKSPEKYWTLYELAEKLVDLENSFRNWRFQHLTTVERIIGFKKGTGGTEGVSYLKRMLDTKLFPELLSVRGLL